MSTHSQSGFTILEIVLVVALISLMAGVGLRMPYLFAPERQQSADVFLLVTALYRAQTLASVHRSDSAWGVSISDAEATVFRGDSFGERDAADDEHILFESEPLVGGTTEVVFSRSSGFPISAATISMTFGGTGATVTINPYGVINSSIED